MSKITTSTDEDMSDREERCKNCKFFEYRADDAGKCRRYPPQRRSELSELLNMAVNDFEWEGKFVSDLGEFPIPRQICDLSDFPSVWNDEWCGEWQPIVEPRT